MISRSNPSRRFSFLAWVTVLATGVLASARVANAQATFAVLHSFIGPDGAHPLAGLIQSPDGTLYGTTFDGGITTSGTVFQMASDGSAYAILHSFIPNLTDGVEPSGSLIQGPDGTLYGTTLGGGTTSYGTIFQVAPDGSGYTVLHSFTGGVTDGAYPSAGLIQGPDGTLYGTTQIGNGGLGTIFQVAPDGSGYTVLHSFIGTDGAQPTGGLIQGSDGTLYGTTLDGGTTNLGTVFQMAPDGNGFTILHSFAGADGYGPYGGLLQGPDGTLYGTTQYGGSLNLGVVFQLTLSPSALKSGPAGHK